jgi:hypothetical protein
MGRLLSSALPMLATGMLVGNLVLAQEQGPRASSNASGTGLAGGAILMLVGAEQIQKELKMSEDQVGKVRKLEDEQLASMAGVFTLPPVERDQRLADIQKQGAELDKKVKDLLSAEQSTRLGQIQLWMGGVAVLTTDQEAAKAVKLTETQKDKIKMIIEENLRKRAELSKGLRGARREEQAKIRQELAALKNDGETACITILTDVQMSRFEELRGPKFEFDEERAKRESRARRRGQN